MFLPPIDVAVLIRDVNASNEAVALLYSSSCRFGERDQDTRMGIHTRRMTESEAGAG